MCFSAGASFAGGVIISTVGVASLQKAGRLSQRLLASIPLLFGLQQFAEGVLWITLRSNGNAWFQTAATYVFLGTALVIWPVMIPLSVWFMEGVKKRKYILTGFIVMGSLLSLFYAFCLIAYDVIPQISNFHIQYIDNFPRTLVNIALVFYLASTIIPLFISSVRRMWIFGVLITISCLVTVVFFGQYLTSVWCFFAALISVVIYWVLSGSQTVS